MISFEAICLVDIQIYLTEEGERLIIHVCSRACNHLITVLGQSEPCSCSCTRCFVVHSINVATVCSLYIKLNVQYMYSMSILTGNE